MPIRLEAAERPARPLPDGIEANMRFDLLLVHAAVVIPGLVVVADMLQAKHEVVVQPFARFRGTVKPLGRAAGVLAQPDRGGPVCPRPFKLKIAYSPHIPSMGLD